MIEKEHALMLVKKYQELLDPNNNNEHLFTYKQCALIAVDEIIYNCYEDMEYFWQEVKREIEKL